MEGALSWVKGRCKCPDVGVPPSAAGREAWPKGKKQRRLRGESIREEMGVCVCVCVCACIREEMGVHVCSGRGVQAGECQVITPLKASSDPLGVRSWAKCWYLK